MVEELEELSRWWNHGDMNTRDTFIDPNTLFHSITLFTLFMSPW